MFSSILAFVEPTEPLSLLLRNSGVPTGGGLGFQTPSPEIPKALQNRAKLNPILKTVTNCWI